MSKRNSFYLATFCLVSGVFIARLPVTIEHVASLAGVRAGEPDWQAALADVRELIMERYVEKPDEAALLKGAIRGMTEALNDPYTEFIEPSDKAAFEKDLTGRFVGIGASVITRDGWLTIAYPLEQSPAYKAGLRPGDVVREISGKSTQGLAVDECVKLLLGEPGTRVTLSIARDGLPEGQTLPVEIERGPIAARSVRGFRFDSASEDWDYLIDPKQGVAYVRVDQFTPGVASEFIAGLRSAGSARSLIIDLRDNPGGLMDQAIQIVDLFMDEGLIVSTKGRTGEGERYEARKGSLGDVPVVVLVNQASASASEIVAGALADNNRAVVVGTRSFGKGLVQRVEPLFHVPDAQLKLTEQHYYLPSGRLIQRTDKSSVWGVDPSPGFYVPLSDEQQRTVWTLRREMETIRPPVMIEGARMQAPPPERDRELASKVHGPSARWSDPDWVEQTAQDPQLAAALRAVQARLASGAWTPTGKPVPDQPVAIATVELTRLEKERERLERFLTRLEDRIAALAEGRQAGVNQRPTDLWDDPADLTGGRLDVFDRAGRRVASLDITGPDVERWLLDADVKPPARPGEQGAPGVAPADGEPATKPTDNPAGEK